MDRIDAGTNLEELTQEEVMARFATGLEDKFRST